MTPPNASADRLSHGTMLDFLLQEIVDESNWLPLSMTFAALAVGILVFRLALVSRQPIRRIRRRPVLEVLGADLEKASKALVRAVIGIPGELAE